MSYSIIVRPTDSTGRFTLVEKTVWHYANGGTWGPSVNGIEMLIMNGSGTSGCLRYRSNAGEYFVVVLGVHNYKPWVDIAIDLSANENSATVNGEWYGSGKRNQNWVQSLEAQKTSNCGTLVDLRILSQNGNQYDAQLNIVDA